MRERERAKEREKKEKERDKRREREQASERERESARGWGEHDLDHRVPRVEQAHERRDRAVLCHQNRHRFEGGCQATWRGFKIPWRKAGLLKLSR